MMKMRNLRSDTRGATAIEFALLSPVLILIIVGIAQLGILFMANAGLRNAVAEGARYATIHPRPSDTQVRDRIATSRFGLDPTRLSTPSVARGTQDGVAYAEISVNYSVPLNFVFFPGPAVTLTETRRAWTYSS